ncbi:serine protease inhibitor, putative [Entamoeba histolytica HM-1:IMSS-B]|uniref:Serine protease inhibitor, putative n=5 Tax=Entamoeba histolytica TaxID=5759 RepID=C4M4Y1_ENTH1|nr:serine protease inhibitor, putative [Entamoeba histolytica HM-1:IMSS]EMH73920.1 serine protease inhibitor, putative [Entamoeba histolytica HM-1:IMSS-B]ENY62779.1 leukocyte elastase inhibitor, putative [Entamoeba histolytica HM-1:IMSS-A]BAN37501.1 serine protease inhibitor, putative [Entamoeba histolytica]EAL44876.1 serine protease inhibitor, putative [Entamoeba histolytica HM-1:IMSS]GAT96449.1 serine protease inhibitor putative [Entamoeba histolytica]|eukprot:XP_650262.1 serine protease inhibitor, putative [Entamoeba histolytica HM-1:IMSS]
MSMDYQDIENMQIALYKLCVDWYNSSPIKEDIVFSTHSMFIAFSLLYIGAAAETKTQLEKVFGFASIPERNFIKFLQSIIKQQDPTMSVTVDIVNGIWASQKLEFTEEYKKAITTLDCQLKNVNFGNDSENIRQEINKFVEEATRKVIVDFLQPGTISGDTIAVIVNAIYFKGEWETPFKIVQKKMKFEGDEEVVVMKERIECSAVFTEKYTSVSIPYVGNQYSMVIIMPNNMKEFEKENMGELKEYVRRTIQEFSEKRNVTIPKFKIETSFSMNQQLKQLGLINAFDERADFSKMAKGHFCVSEAIHKAVVEVDEKGTIAAAATGIALMRCCLPLEPPRDVIINKPYFFVIIGEEQYPLFFGKVSHPRFK